jgi:hypothetical protein
MDSQNYANHRRYVLMYHVVLFVLLIVTLIGSLNNLRLSIGTARLYCASLIVVLVIIGFFLFFFCRSFALKAQDRAIRAEENLRHFILTGKPLDGRLHIRQVIGLRFAADEEFVELARRAAEEGLSEDAIKKAIKNWKGDTYRV